jgi:hypothetical protein
VAYDPDAAEAASWLRRYYLRSFNERYEAWLDVFETWPLEWQEVADASDYLLRVSPARLAELQAELWATILRYRNGDPEDPDAKPIEIQVHAFPLVDRTR